MPAQRPVSRRTFLRSMAVALAGAGGLGLTARAALASSDHVIGWSQGGLPLVIHRLGTGPIKLFILGGHHGAPEGNTNELVHMIRDHLMAHPDEVPRNVTVYLMPEGNPDGLMFGGRQYL